MMVLTSLANAQKLDAKKTISKYAELNLSLGYNDGSSISLKLQEYRGPYNPENFKLYKEANDKLTEERPKIQKELAKMGAFFERHIANSECKKTLIELKAASRGLGMIKGMHGIASTNEESISQDAAQKGLAGLNSDLKFKANSLCKESIESEMAEVLN